MFFNTYSKSIIFIYKYIIVTMNGITYFRKTSPYPGDVTKKCALDGYEVDNNFYTLEGRDIKSVTVNGDDLVITLLNGETITSKNAFQTFTKDISFEFDTTRGILYVHRNGETQEITGFASTYNTGETIAVDETMKGSGEPCNPIGVSRMHQTGQYKPVIKLIDTCNCEKLPHHHKRLNGDRYITVEYISDYGLLYNFDAVKRIACDLQQANSPWRIPTKEDWDDMLNAIEPCDSDKDHASATSNKYLGRYAGKLLKSKDLWKLECDNTHVCCDNNHNCDCHDSSCCSPDFNPCEHPYCGEVGNHHCHPEIYPNKGVDKYGFNINPTGYADDACNYGYFLERACFWTSTNAHYTNAYVKRFEYNKSSVYQDVLSGDFYLSLRLIKDYNGHNYNERENILDGTYSTVLMPSQKNGHAIWTSCNIDLSNQCYKPVLPNNGMGLTKTKRYFINEWNGKEWLRNELKEGESVVIFDAPNGNKNVEYRIIHGELTDVSLTTYEDVMTAVTPKLEHLKCMIRQETERAVARENQIENNLMSEIERSTNRDNELEEKINQGNEKINEELNQLHFELDETNKFITQGLNEVKGLISEETERAISAENRIETKLDEEIERSTQEDIRLDTKIDNKINALDEKFTNEINRIDETINTNVSDLNKRLDDTNTRIDEVIGRVDETNVRIDETNKRVDDTNLRVDETNNRLNDTNVRVDSISERLDETNVRVDETNVRIDETNKRIDEINKQIEDLTGEDGNINTKLEELNKKIDEEIERSTQEDIRLETKLDEEIERSTQEDEYIKGRLISKEGHEYNCRKGYIKLATDDEENAIVINIESNYGVF